VVVNKFSKLAKFTRPQINTTVVGMAKLFFDMWVQHNWMLEVIVSDRDVKFMSEFWMLLMKKANRS
jgi:hypothetical protein